MNINQRYNSQIYGKKRKNTPHPKFRYVLLFLLFTIGIFLLIQYINSIANPRILVKTMTSIPGYTASSTLSIQKEALLLKTGGIIKSVDAKGTMNWTIKSGLQAPEISISSDALLLYENKTVKAYKATGSLLFQKEISDPILDAKIGLKFAALLFRSPDSSYSITLLDLVTSKVVDTIKLPGQSITNMGFRNDNSFWVISLDTNSATPISRITTYNPGKSLTGAITIPEQIIYRIIFTGDNILAVGTNSILCYNSTGQKQEETMIYGWNLFSVSPDKNGSFNMLLTHENISSLKNSDSITSIRLINNQFKDIPLTLSLPCRKFFMLEQKMVCVSRSELRVIGYEKQDIIQIPLPFPIEDILLSESGKTLYILQNGKLFSHPISF